MDVDKVDGVHEFNWGNKGWVGVRLASIVFCNGVEDEIRLSYRLLQPLIDGVLVLVEPLFQ